MIQLKTIIIFFSVNSYNRPLGQIQFPCQPVNIVPQILTSKTLTKTREPINPNESTETEERRFNTRIKFGTDPIFSFTQKCRYKALYCKLDMYLPLQCAPVDWNTNITEFFIFQVDFCSKLHQLREPIRPGYSTVWQTSQLQSQMET